MTRPTLEDVRELSQRSRRTQRRGALAVGSGLMLFPSALFVAAWQPAWQEWASILALGLAGLAAVWWAHAAGQERGAYRKLFRELKVARKLAVKKGETSAEAQAPAAP